MLNFYKIDWKLIETHYHAMLRVAISIQKGKVKASTILRKLCSKSRKNKVYFSFKELKGNAATNLGGNL